LKKPFNHGILSWLIALLGEVVGGSFAAAHHQNKSKKQIIMSETTMPVTEVEQNETETVEYELAFHVLPTVAEGEVAKVVDTLKGYITAVGGTITDEEKAAHFELAYEIEKYLEGKYRRFNTAYFGWVRFMLTPEALAEVIEEVEGNKSILRHLVVRLTREESANPFRFHESIADRAPRTIDVDDLEEASEESEGEDVEKEEGVEAEAEAEETNESQD